MHKSATPQSGKVGNFVDQMRETADYTESVLAQAKENPYKPLLYVEKLIWILADITLILNKKDPESTKEIRKEVDQAKERLWLLMDAKNR